jgi:hypothetical protein
VQDELNPNWSPPSLPNGFPPDTRHFSKFEGTRIAYVTTGNPERVRLESPGYSLPAVSVYAIRGGVPVFVDVGGHTHPVSIAEKILAKVFART